jgi:YD repeat-containing protein
MSIKLQYHSHPGRKPAFWGLVVALVLILTVGSAGAVGPAGMPRSWASSELSPSAIRHAPLARMHPANMPIADERPANPQASNARTVTFSYDRNGRLTSANYGDGVLLVYRYDPAGNLEGVTGRLCIFLPLVVRQ